MKIKLFSYPSFFHEKPFSVVSIIDIHVVKDGDPVNVFYVFLGVWWLYFSFVFSVS